MTNEKTHTWVDIDDGQVRKRCKCGTMQNDDGSVTAPDGTTRDGYFPRCIAKSKRRIKESGKQQPLPLARAKATQLQLGG